MMTQCRNFFSNILVRINKDFHFPIFKRQCVHVALTFTPQYNKPKPLSSALLMFVNLYLITFGIKEMRNHCEGVMDSHMYETYISNLKFPD